MKRVFSEITAALSDVFAVRSRIPLMLALSAGFFWLLVMVPVWSTPGNDFLFQLSLFGPSVIALLIALSVLNGLLIVMHVHIHRLKAQRAQRGQTGKDAVGGAGILASSLAATVGCASCYSSVLALLGLGGATFIVEHRWWFGIGALSLTLFAVYHTAKRINGHCRADTCRIA